jgi:hypothetical protein
MVTRTQELLRHAKTCQMLASMTLHERIQTQAYVM